MFLNKNNLQEMVNATVFHEIARFLKDKRKDSMSISLQAIEHNGFSSRLADLFLYRLAPYVEECLQKLAADGILITEEKGKTPPETKDANTNTSFKDFDSLYLCSDTITEKEDVATLLSDIESLYNSSRFADVILRLGKHEFPAHKLVLRSRSKVFAAMFEHDLRETRQDAVDLADMEIDTVKLMLRYIYSGKVRQLSPEEAFNLYVAADRYDLQKLVFNCRKIMLNKLSIDNVCEIASVADLHNDQLLLDAVKSFLFTNMKEVFKTDKWMMFAKRNPVLSWDLIHSAVINN